MEKLEVRILESLGFADPYQPAAPEAKRTNAKKRP
jgi:hypothetical protein